MWFEVNEWVDSQELKVLPERWGRGTCVLKLSTKKWCPWDLSSLWIQLSLQDSYFVCQIWWHLYVNITFYFIPQNVFSCSAFVQTTYSCNFCWRLFPWASSAAGLWFLSEGQDFMGCCFLSSPVWQKYPVILTTVWPQLQWHLPPFLSRHWIRGSHHAFSPQDHWEGFSF